MFLNYIPKIMWRNKKRTLFLMLGILIAISLITSVDAASSRMAGQMLQDQLQYIGVDFRVTPSVPEPTSIIHDLEEFEIESEIFEYVFETIYTVHDYTFIQPGGGPIDMDVWNVSIRKGEYYNRTHLAGFDRNIFSNSPIQTRLDAAIKFPSEGMNTTTPGIYIDSGTAHRYELSKGDNISYGVFYQVYIYEDPEYNVYNFTAEIQNIPILDVVELRDTSIFAQYFQSMYGYYQTYVYFYSEDNVFIGNLLFMNNLYETIRNQFEAQIPPQYSFFSPLNKGYNLFIDYTQLNLIDSTTTELQLTQMTNALENVITDEYEVFSTLQDAISSIQAEMTAIQILLTIIAVPVILLSWFLVRTNFYLTYSQRRRELGLLKSKGGRSRKIGVIFFFEAIIIGILGGGIGFILGNLSSPLILAQMIPDSISSELQGDMIASMFSLTNSTLNRALIGIFGGIGLSIIAMSKPLSDFLKQMPIDSLSKYQEESGTETELTKKKSDWVFLILGLLPLVSALILTGIQDWSLQNYYFIVVIMGVTSPLLPFSPFILIYALVKILCARSVKLFTKIIQGITRLFSRNIGVFSAKSILRNQVRSARLVFIVAISVGFMLLASTVAYSEVQFQEEVTTIQTGDGMVVQVNSVNLTTSMVQNYSNQLWNNSETLGLNGLNYMWHPIESGLWRNGKYIFFEQDITNDWYGGILSAVCITSENYTKFMNLKDRWFDKISVGEAFSRLQTIENATLMPSYLQELGYNEYDVVELRYQINSTKYDTKFFTIVGFYKLFPLISEDYQPYMIIDTDSLKEAQVDKVSLILYSELDPLPTSDEILTVLLEIDPNVYLYYYYPYGPYEIQPSAVYDSPFSDIMQFISRFMDLESYYMLMIVTIGVGIIMYISIREKSRDMGMLRARGITKKEIFKIQLAEATTLVILGVILSLIGLLGARAIILELDIVFSFMSRLHRVVLVPWLKIGLQLLGTFGLFMGIIAIAVAIETKKSDIGPISELLRTT